MTTHCPFCQIPPERIIAQNTHAFVIRDGFPVSPGHTLIIPKRHVGSFFETTQDEKLALLALLDDAQNKLSRNGVGAMSRNGVRAIFAQQNISSDPLSADSDNYRLPDGYNIGINDGPAAGQTVPHLHIHLIPRYTGDVEDPRGGVRWVVPEKADYWSGRE